MSTSPARSLGVAGRARGASGVGRPPVVAVIGAGIGGLTLVAALARAGVRVELYEQGRGRPSSDGGLQLAPNAVRLLHRLGLTDALRTRGVHPRAVEMRGWRDDRPHATMSLGRACRELYGVPYYTLQRTHLRQALSALVGHATIQAGRRLVQVSEQIDGAWLEFADGAVRRADVVVGADGVGSAVRHALTEGATDECPPNDRSVPTGSAVCRGLVPAARVPQLFGVPRVLVWSRPGQRCVCFPVDAGRTMSFAATMPVSARSRAGSDSAEAEAEAESWTAEGALNELRAAYDGWNPAVGALLDAADRAGRWELRDRKPLTRWSTDRLTLLGDAAQPELVCMAQSTSQAVEDAVTLARCLRGASTGMVPGALRRYEELRMPRRDAVLNANREPSAPTTRGPRGRLHRKAPVSGLDGTDQTGLLGAMDWLYGYDADREALPSASVNGPVG